MKQFKRITGVALAFVFVLTTAVTALAATPEQEQEVLSHAFNVYQIMVANSVNGELLTSVDWGDGFDGSGFLTDIKGSSDFAVNNSNIFASCTKAPDVAGVIENYEDDSEIVKAFANHARSFTGERYGGKTYKSGDSLAEAGYYLFEDASNADVKNPVILKMAADSKIKIEVKASVPMVEKKVLEDSFDHNCTSTTLGAGNVFRYGTGYNDAADYDIGDAVPFELIGTLPENLNDYDEFYYAFIDTMSEGLTFRDADKASVRVSLYKPVNGEYKMAADVTSAFTVVPGNDSTIKFECEDVLSSISGVTPDSIIIVNFNALLNEKAVIGLDGNENNVYLEYSNVPGTDSHGRTKIDKVIVFTYEIDVTKTDPDGEGVKDVQFLLLNNENKFYAKDSAGTRWTSSESDAQVFTSDADGKFTIAGLDEGDYKLREKSAPDGFKMIDGDIGLKITAALLCDKSDEASQTWSGTPADALISLTSAVTNNPENAAQNISAEAGDGATALTVINERTFDLPGTGGKGVMIPQTGQLNWPIPVLAFSGVVLIIAGVAMLRKKRDEK